MRVRYYVFFHSAHQGRNQFRRPAHLNLSDGLLVFPTWACCECETCFKQRTGKWKLDNNVFFCLYTYVGNGLNCCSLTFFHVISWCGPKTISPHLRKDIYPSSCDTSIFTPQTSFLSLFLVFLHLFYFQLNFFFSLFFRFLPFCFHSPFLNNNFISICGYLFFRLLHSLRSDTILRSTIIVIIK